MAWSRRLLLPLFTLSVAIPVTAQAGFFTFFMGLWSGANNADAVSTEVNSQNVELLKAALNYDPNPSKGGGDITIVGGSALLPDVGPSGSLADIEENHQNSDQISIYVVREGDSLSQIAKMFGVTTNTIIWANDIQRGSLIRPGQTLTILPVTGIEHTVVKGETLASIAKKYGGDVDEIVQYNNLDPKVALAVGQEIIIPDGEIAVPKAVTSSTIYEPAHDTGGPAYVGYYAAPLSHYTKTQGLHGYNAVDLAAPIGTPVMAAASGVVIVSRDAGWNGGYGQYIVIKHDNGTQTLYAHLSRNIVYSGRSVVQGQVIGYVGSTGKSTGPHLHFEVRGAKNPF